MNSSADTVISVDKIRFSYGAAGPVLENVSFAVREGEHVSLVGPNGSGKSTLFRILAGFLRPASGRVLLGGADIRAMSPLERAKRLSFVPQDIRADFPFNCLEVVLMALYPHRSRLAATDEADIALAAAMMRETGVWRFADKKISELSGGERQRVIISRALLQIESAPSGGKGGLLLLDEAMSALDVAARIDMMKLLSARASARASAIIGIHHDLQTAAGFSSRVLALHRGRIAASGPPRSVFTEPFFKTVFSVKAEITPGGFLIKDSAVLMNDG
ncbi:MAG: ABC transporter ATP-binding protein [Spirochaetaceae bacterium]|nr:ABC transporter ATP-binding protein [Spirochaetaceae bacterium]